MSRLISLLKLTTMMAGVIYFQNIPQTGVSFLPIINSTSSYSRWTPGNGITNQYSVKKLCLARKKIQTVGKGPFESVLNIVQIGMCVQGKFKPVCIST